MELSEEKLNKIYSNHPYLSLFLDAYEREVLYDEWGRLLDVRQPCLTDKEIIDLVDWWKKKHSEQKYTIQIFPNSFGYLNISNDDSKADVGDLTECRSWNMTFTKSEIEQLKQRDDIAIDWDKAKIEPVEEESNEK